MTFQDIEERFFRDSQKLMNALFAQRDLSYILDVACSLFGNPIFAIDSGFKLIARSSGDVDDTIWNDLAQNGYYSYSNLKISKLDKRYPTIMRSKKTILINVNSSIPQLPENMETDCTVLNLENSSLLYSRLVCNIYDKQSRLGSITIIDSNNNFELYHIKLAEFLCKIVLMQIKQNPFTAESKGMPFGSLVMDLLNQNIKNTDMLNARLQFLNFTPKKYFYIFAVRFRETNMSPEELKPLETTLSNMLGSHSIIYNSHIVFVFNTDDKCFIQKSKKDRLCAIFNENSLYGGISYQFTNLMAVKQFYTQAVKAIEFGSIYDQQRAPIFSYGNYSILDFINAISSSHNLSDYCHPAIAAISQYTNTIILATAALFICI